MSSLKVAVISQRTPPDNGLHPTANSIEFMRKTRP